MGAGSAKRLSAVKWSLAGEILKAWVLTIPVAMTFGGTACWLIHFLV
jgi:PiT family inorganic phosphate transporter